MEVLLENFVKLANTNQVGARKINDKHTSTKKKRKEKKTEREKYGKKGNEHEEMTKLWMILKELFSLEYSSK